MPQSHALIGHLDADCFYVSCERVRFPYLAKLPVGVLGNQGACIIAKSYEMKKRGVKTGIPIWEASKLCPEGIFVKRDFYWYEVISKQMLEMVKTISTAVEYYSIDELFFDATFLSRAFNLPLLEAAKALQQRMLQEIGMPVSIGISRSKTLAKLASDTNKPFGCHVAASPEEIAILLEGKPVDDITGIAGRSKQKLASYSIYTCDQLVKADPKLIRRLLTIKGEQLLWEMRGTAINPLKTTRPPHKAMARGGSVGGATDDPMRLRGWIVRNVERLAEALHYYNFSCDRLALYLSYKEGGSWYGRMDLMEATDEFENLVTPAKDLFEAGWRKGHKVGYVHVIAESLQYSNSIQMSLFTQHSDRMKSSELMRLVNAKIGRFALRSAETLPLKDIYDDAANDYEICDVAGKLCF
jgi:nucleotidyltransferase/DNA polymerase involved in DNA repair